MSKSESQEISLRTLQNRACVDHQSLLFQENLKQIGPVPSSLSWFCLEIFHHHETWLCQPHFYFLITHKTDSLSLSSAFMIWPNKNRSLNKISTQKNYSIFFKDPHTPWKKDLFPRIPSRRPLWKHKTTLLGFPNITMRLRSGTEERGCGYRVKKVRIYVQRGGRGKVGRRCRCYERQKRPFTLKLDEMKVSHTLFISTEMKVYTHTGSRTSRTTTSWMWSSNTTIVWSTTPSIQVSPLHEDLETHNS